MARTTPRAHDRGPKGPRPRVRGAAGPAAATASRVPAGRPAPAAPGAPAGATTSATAATESQHPALTWRAFRMALRGLTTRGRSFAAAGITAVVCAYALGQPALLRVGVLLAALPPAAAVLLVRTRFRVAGGRRLTPRRVPAGQEARAFLRVDNVSRIPTGVLMLEDQVPQVLGPRPRFVLDRVEPRGHREVTYRVRSDLRGRYRLGPLQLRLSDPFGLCELTRSFSASDVLTVVPAVQHLPPVRLAGQWTGYGDSRSRALALAGEDDVVPRGYRQGDDLRRVHWRSTAKYGELMVRREEQPLRSRATVLLDTRAIAHRGRGAASSFEWAVSAAASIALHLRARGYAIRLLTDTGESVETTGNGDTVDESGLLLDTLAGVRLSDSAGLGRAEDVLRLGGEGLVVAVLGELGGEQVATLSRLRRRTGAALALHLATDSWADPQPAANSAGGSNSSDGPSPNSTAGANGGGPAAGSAPTPAAGAADPAAARHRLLRNSGWTVLQARHGDSLPALWATLDRPAADYSTRPHTPEAAGPAQPTGAAEANGANGAGGANGAAEAPRPAEEGGPRA